MFDEAKIATAPPSALKRALALLFALQFSSKVESGYCETCYDIYNGCPECEGDGYHLDRCNLGNLLKEFSL